MKSRMNSGMSSTAPRSAATALCLLLIAATGASAQLQFGGTNSNFGSTTLAPGFTPDPHTVSIVSGGSLNVSSMNLGDGCVGYATQQPDYIVTLTSNSSRLRFYVEGEGDTGLIVGAPGKRFSCNDDEVGLDPMVNFDNAQAGQYNVWVSSYSDGESIASTLYVTELEYLPNSDGLGSIGTGDFLEIGGDDSFFGRTTLAPGFTPDPHTVSVTSGGSIDVSTLELGTSCVGYATARPDYILDYARDGSMLRFYMEGDGDTALIINAPDGSWHCNDDSYGTVDPTVTFEGAMSGQYDVWIASYSSGTNISGTLSITELNSNRPGG